MKRGILNFRRGDRGCCPGHDKFPEQKYNSNRSRKARKRDRKIENQLVRSLQKREVYNFLHDV